MVVNCGTGRSFAITPTPGYYIADVLVDGGSVGAVTFSTIADQSLLSGAPMYIPLDGLIQSETQQLQYTHLCHCAHRIGYISGDGCGWVGAHLDQAKQGTIHNMAINCFAVDRQAI